MADGLMLTESVWIFLLIVEVIDGEFQFATPASLELGKVWYGRKEFSLTIPCVTEEKPGDKYKGAMYSWREKNDDRIGYLGFRRTIYGNGTLSIVDLQTTDTGRIDCIVSKIETSQKFVFTHSVVVYYVAEFSMINPFVYTVPNCDEVLTVNKLHDLLEFACDEHRKRLVMCPFTARKDCLKKTPAEVVESSEGAYRLRIIIEQQPEKEFIVPDCSLKCMKKSVIGHLQQYGDDLLRRLAKREDHSQSSLFKGFVFEKEELLNRRIRTTCVAGFELYQYILCMPCFPGSYVTYSYQFDETLTPQSQCLPCDFGYYQDKFALDECQRCPSMGTTATNGTADVNKCTTSAWNIAFAYYAIGGILAVAVVATCIGMCFVIASQKKKEKEARQRMEEISGSETSDVTSTAASMGSGVPQQMGSGVPQQMGSGVPQQMGSGVPQQMGSGVPQQMGSGVPQQQQQWSNNATAINVNVNRRFSRSSGVVGRSLSRTSTSLTRQSPSEEDPECLSDSSSDSSSRRPMLQGSSPAVMQSTWPRLS